MFSEDIEAIVSGLEEIENFCAIPIELGVSLYMLKQRVGPAYVAIFIPTISK